MLFHSANLPYWIFLGMGVLLFVLVIVSGGGDDDLGTDADLDSDLDSDLDAESDVSFAAVLGWLGIGKAPLLLLLATDFSLIGLVGWILNVILGEAIGQPPNGFWVSVVAIAALVIALMVGKLLAQPIGKAFASFGEDTSSDRLIGCLGTVTSAVIPPQAEARIGQVDVIDAARNRVSINAMLPEWAAIAPRLGDQVLVVDRLSQIYLVILKDSPDQDSWLANPSRKQSKP